MKILIIDDHPVLRAGVAALLHQDAADTEVAQAGTLADALRIVAERDDLDAVVLDLMLPGTDGFAAIGELIDARPDLPVIILSSSEDPHDVRNAFAHGASGYVPKSSSRGTLAAAIRLVLSGDLYVPPLIIESVSSIRSSGLRKNALTVRQIEVLRCVCEGLANKTIAAHLGLSEKTVKAHITAIFRALNVVNRTQAAIAAREAGLI
ncbi:response regulator transcription factor [Burkholderia sp. FERM BP-3421]|jgi:DNA-binding NarL/FixJ family response regulator|uniref:response regulator transcription factor n=1 Tax=Burkholderia sp. FERM BP-3421 TaxID=1494466 RepID=UPI00235F0893|nr:response regulator transcription factor [Burkholderia sp. FERM BP-3421]WDD92499.1 response regulator transcription factor [Burkholderia sp. FERM BP-3421]